jgi:hypothetical protein
MCPGVWPGVATATILPSSVSGRLAANDPNGPPSSANGWKSTPSGRGCRNTRAKNRDRRLCANAISVSCTSTGLRR